MSTVSLPTSQQSLVLDNITWETYCRLRRALQDRSGLRLTYDRGVLEIMTLSAEHERLKHLLRRLLEALCEELDIRIAGYGSMTCRRRKKRRGLEPDECYYVANEPRIRGRYQIDLRVDPPPDLAIEVDVTHSSLDRLSVYAALGVAEVWRLHNQSLTFHLLDLNHRYTASTHSQAFPRLAAADLAGFLTLGAQHDEITIVRQFRAWVRQNLATAAVTPPNP